MQPSADAEPKMLQSDERQRRDQSDEHHAESGRQSDEAEQRGQREQHGDDLE